MAGWEIGAYIRDTPGPQILAATPGTRRTLMIATTLARALGAPRSSFESDQVIFDQKVQRAHEREVIDRIDEARQPGAQSSTPGERAQHVPGAGPSPNAAGAMCVRPLAQGWASSTGANVRSNSASGMLSTPRPRISNALSPSGNPSRSSVTSRKNANLLSVQVKTSTTRSRTCSESKRNTSSGFRKPSPTTVSPNRPAYRGSADSACSNRTAGGRPWRPGTRRSVRSASWRSPMRARPRRDNLLGSVGQLEAEEPGLPRHC